MLKKGIYENIINQRMEREIHTAETENLVCVREEIDNTEAPQMLADYLAKAIRQKLQETEDLQDRMAIINRILTEYGLIEDVQITDTSNLLMEVMTQEKNLLQQNSRSETIRPQSGFRVSNLFTGGNSALSLGEEIRREIDKTEFKDAGMYKALDILHEEEYRYFKQEIEEIVSYRLENLEITTSPLGDTVLPGIELYGCYTREEIFTLTGRQTENRRMQGSVSGVFTLPEYNTTLLFVTLNKSDKDFSPSTQYDDYIINKDYFHWQSKNTDAHNNAGGQIYTRQPEKHNKIVLFVREEKKDGFGNTTPFHCFGLVDYVSSHGNFPMNITWKLHQPVMAQYLKVV